MWSGFYVGPLRMRIKMFIELSVSSYTKLHVHAFEELQIIHAKGWAIWTKGKFPVVMKALLEYNLLVYFLHLIF
jgi:hypothetical protein